MPRTALVLGATGRIGRHVADAFEKDGWTVRRFRRGEDLVAAARGASIIVNGWNPPYPQWASEVPALTAEVINAAQQSGAAVMIPGNVYVYGAEMPPVIGPGVAQAATNPLGRIRVEMEAAYRAAGVQTVILRAGDFLDTAPSGNWFDRIIAAKIDKGKLSYPGELECVHAWAYLPDLAAAFVALANRVDDLPRFVDLAFEGYTLTARDLAAACTDAFGKPVSVSAMSWVPLRMMAPVWPMARHLNEMRYLWNVPHRLDGTALAELCPDLPQTPLRDALKGALEAQIHPDKAMV